MSEVSTERDGPQRPVHSGQIVVLAMLGVALVAASFAWWWNYQRGRRALEFYGPEAATLIRTAPKVELLYMWEPARDVSKAEGLLNARTSLLNDASYDWNAATKIKPSQYAIRFVDGDKSVTISFDDEYRSIGTSSTGKLATLTKKMADGWRSYLERIGPEGRQEIAPTVRSGNHDALNP